MSVYLADVAADVLTLQENLVSEKEFEPRMKIKGFTHMVSCGAYASEISGLWIGNSVYASDVFLKLVTRDGLAPTTTQQLKGCATSRCATLLRLSDPSLRIATMHSCGGAQDDNNFSKKGMGASKGAQLQSIISAWAPDILTGDFNGPLDLAGAKDVIARHPVAQAFSEKKQASFAAYLTSHATVAENNGYAPAFTDKDIGATFAYGNNPSWIFYKPEHLRVTQVTAIDTHSTSPDQAGTIVTLAFIADS